MSSFTVTDDVIRFHVWAPKLTSIDVVGGDGSKLLTLQKNSDGVFGGVLASVSLPLQYFFVVDGERRLPDPCSTYLPEDVHGPSEIGKSEFIWSDGNWNGIDKSDLLIYELHLGAFSEAGTYVGCREQLDYLCDLGVTAIELLPLAQCPGRWNWGYDGVGLFAPNSRYGTIDELKGLIDDCHGRGLSVIHDVVYNHVGPEGNYLGAYAKYFSSKHGTPWGSAFGFDGRNKQRARQLVIDNAIYWLDEFHFDGLRLDAIHFMFDDSGYSIQQEICDRVRDFEQQAGRRIHLIGEANIYDHGLIVDSTQQRKTYSAIWADDLMHAVLSVADAGDHLTPRTYVGGEDVVEALNHGYLYEGPVMKRVTTADRKQNHGEELTDKRYLDSLIIALQTHDSIGNHPQGKRLHHLAGEDFQMAAAPLFWLYPAIPMMFMGEEFAADEPFMFFADFLEGRLRNNVNRGRMKEYPHHDWSDSMQPCDERAFYSCKLQMPDNDNKMLCWYRSLIVLRKHWKELGVMSPGNLTVCCDAEKGIFGFRYSFEDNRMFVLSNLAGTGAEVRPENGEVRVLLDSHKSANGIDENRQNVFSISKYQSVVGLGNVLF